MVLPITAVLRRQVPDIEVSKKNAESYGAISGSPIPTSAPRYDAKWPSRPDGVGQ